MPFEKYFDEISPATQPACIYLRSKSMYVHGQLKNPEHPSEESLQQCWCNITQHVKGPDQSEVNRYQCIPGRECYRNAHE